MTFYFASPHFLILLLAPLLLTLYLAKSGNRTAGLSFSNLSVAELVQPSKRLKYSKSLHWLRMVVISILVLALARPQLGHASEAAPAEGIDIVLALDVSYSMADRDLGPKTRLETAKEVIREFIGSRQNDRLGLVAFAGQSITLSPMTLDYPSLLELLDRASHGRLPEGTAIGSGIASSINLLRESRAKSRITILLTDGQNNTGEIAPLKAAQMAQILRTKVYTIGVGAEPPSPSRRGGGPPSASQGGVDEDTLRQISETTGAAYFRATDQNALKEIYEIIGKLEKSQVGEKRYGYVDELGPYLLLFSSLILFIEMALSNTFFRKIP